MAFQLLPLLLQIAIGVGLQILGYLIMGKPKGPKPDEVKDMENPTAEAGRPIPVVFGEIEVSGVNIIFFGDKQTKTVRIKA